MRVLALTRRTDNSFSLKCSVSKVAAAAAARARAPALHFAALRLQYTQLECMTITPAVQAWAISLYQQQNPLVKTPEAKAIAGANPLNDFRAQPLHHLPLPPPPPPLTPPPPAVNTIRHIALLVLSTLKTTIDSARAAAAASIGDAAGLVADVVVVCA